MHSHKVKTLCYLASEALRKCLKVLKLYFFCGKSELIGYSQTVLDLDRCHLYCCDCCTAVSLCAILCNDIYFTVHVECEYLLTIEGKR